MSAEYLSVLCVSIQEHEHKYVKDVVIALCVNNTYEIYHINQKEC